MQPRHLAFAFRGPEAYHGTEYFPQALPMDRSHGKPPHDPHRRPIHLAWQKSRESDSLRDTGIALVGRIPWGTHMCLFCETKADVLDAGTRYFAAAHGQGEHCVWVVSEPLTPGTVIGHLRGALPEFEEQNRAGRFEVVAATDWFYLHGRFDWDTAVANFHEHVIRRSERRDVAGTRAYLNPLWRETGMWRHITEYERAMESIIADTRVIVLCGYTTETSGAEDVFDVACTHQFAIALRRGRWQFLDLPDNDEARRELDVLNRDLDVLPERVRRRLTERERVVLAQLVHGASSKEAARTLGISPRTIDFHRANMMQKLGARNAAELVAKAVTPSR